MQRNIIEQKMLEFNNRDNWHESDAIEYQELTTKMNNFKKFDRLSQHPLRKIKVNENQVVVTKDMLATPEPSTSEGFDNARRFRFTISTSDVDTSNDVVNQNGWVLDTFKRNPVVLWNHDATKLPVGKCVDIGVENGKLKATVEFATADANPFAEHVYKLVSRGFLNATSVSFSAIEMNETTDPDRGADTYEGGIDFIKQELFEFSIVNLPANTFCLIEPNQRSLDVSGVIKPISTNSTNNIDNDINNHQRDLRKLMLELHSRYNRGI